MSNRTPTRKVAWGPMGGAVGALLVWGIQAIGKVPVPPEAAIALGTVVTFAVQYVIRDARPPEE